jgi:hypothetical protein
VTLGVKEVGVRPRTPDGGGLGSADMSAGRARRLAAVALLVLGCLFYLQFGLQALVHHLPQGILALVGAIALGWGAVRAGRGREAASVVFLGTVPVLVLHAAMTLEDPGELPFFIGSIPAPALAAIAWVLRRSRRR